MKVESTEEQIVSLLERNWSHLKNELGEGWTEFIGSYNAIVERLPPEPDNEDIMRAMMRLLALLGESEAGRRLLREERDLDLRLMESGMETQADRSTVKQVANRLISLREREEKKNEAQEADAAHKTQDEERE